MKKNYIMKIGLLVFVFIALGSFGYAEAATPLTCTPVSATVDVNQQITFKAAGGTGTYAWNAPEMVSRSGDTITVYYPRAGASVMTVTSGSEVASCKVDIKGTVLGESTLSCGPSTRVVLPGQVVNFKATGGTGTYTWTAPNMSAQSGSELNVTYPTNGTSTMVLTSGIQSVTCNVVIGSGSTIPTAPGLPNTGLGGGTNGFLNVGILLGLSGITTMVIRKRAA
jgi:hypothetical protein